MSDVNPSPRLLLLRRVTVAAALVVFAVLLAWIPAEGPYAFDEAVFDLAHGAQPDWLTAAMRTITRLGGGRALAAMTVAVVVVMVRPSWLWALFFGITMATTGVLNQGVKELVARARPVMPEALGSAGGYAFPSGHAMGSAAFFLGLFFVVRMVFPRFQWLAAGVGTVLVAAIGLSRIYLGVHYPTDVLAGWALSTAWVLVLQAWAHSWHLRAAEEPDVDELTHDE